MAETPQERHLLWRAIGASQKVNAVRELHRSVMVAGLPTGECQECGKPYPCPTAAAVAREPDGPCGCGPECPTLKES